MADISVDPFTWSTTAGSNQPSGSTVIGSGLDDNLRAIQAGVKMALDPLSSVVGTNTITATATGLTAYASGQSFEFIPANTNTGATTINITSLGAKSIFYNNAALVGGELRVSVPARIKYDGTQFQLVSAPANSSAWVFLSSGTASSSSSLDFTGLTGYASYAFLLENLVPATDGTALWMRVSKDNSTWHAGANDYAYAINFNLVGTGTGSVNSGGAAQIVLASDSDSGITTQGHSGLVMAHGLASATQIKHFTHSLMGANTTPLYFSNHGGSAAPLTTAVIGAVTGVRFLFSSGNISTGTVRCYGIRGS